MCIVYKKDQNQIDFFYFFLNTAIDVVNGIRYIFFLIFTMTAFYFFFHLLDLRDKISSDHVDMLTVLPAKSDRDDMFCLQS